MPDDIRTEYHPKTKRSATTIHFDDYGRDTKNPFNDGPPNSSPWNPFRTRLDFDVAEFALRAALNKDQTEQLLNLLKRCADRDDECTIRNHNDLTQTWERASHKCVDVSTVSFVINKCLLIFRKKFTKESVSVPYQGRRRQYDVHIRPLWDWALSLVDHPRLISHFTWDAEKIFKFDGVQWVRCFHEPWTGDAWWRIQVRLLHIGLAHTLTWFLSNQSHLPAGASPICFIIYADKTKLSSFGTQKGYPIIARIANLPAHIRNGEGIGGGQIVGWLPIVRFLFQTSHHLTFEV